MATEVSATPVGAQYTAVIKRNSRWWIGWIEELPGVNCQERTRDRLIESLRIFEMNRRDARAAAGTGFAD
jgi:hypothetical protein